MRFPMPAESETRIRVRYAETDQMGVVYYANYLVWMEAGRVDLCKALGFNYQDMELDDGVFLAVAEATCRYRAPARFDDEVVIRTWVAEANTRMAIIAYEMRLAGTPSDGPGPAACWPPGRPAMSSSRAISSASACRRKYHAMFGIAETRR